MSVSRQLYELQEIDSELEADRQKIDDLNRQIGESAELIEEHNALTVEQQQLEEQRKHLRLTETDIKDMESKVAKVDEELYSGRVKNPKELSNLQADMEILKTKRGQLEDRALELMYGTEQNSSKIEGLHQHFEQTKKAWETAQQQISNEIKTLRANVGRLEKERRALVDNLTPEIVTLYDQLLRQKKKAVVRLEKGTCQGCRIILPMTDVQRVKSGRVIQCSSCGRILYLD